MDRVREMIREMWMVGKGEGECEGEGEGEGVEKVSERGWRWWGEGKRERHKELYMYTERGGDGGKRALERVGEGGRKGGREREGESVFK